MKSSKSLDFRNALDWGGPYIVPLEVRMDEETRVRVFATQLQDTVLGDISKFSFLPHVEIYLRLGAHLSTKFPGSKDKVTEAVLSFWMRVQTKLKLEEAADDRHYQG